MNILHDTLINWYAENHRDLPWRHDPTPYEVWLSEVILQQTRVSQGMDYYLRFIEKWPTVTDLAKASEEEVLKMWQGLGYYSRARNTTYPMPLSMAMCTAFWLGSTTSTHLLIIMKVQKPLPDSPTSSSTANNPATTTKP